MKEYKWIILANKFIIAVPNLKNSSQQEGGYIYNNVLYKLQHMINSCYKNKALQNNTKPVCEWGHRSVLISPHGKISSGSLDVLKIV